MEKTEIALGDLAKERITGIEGVVIGVTRWLTGCDHIGVQRTGIDKDGKPWEILWFDDANVEHVQKEIEAAPGLKTELSLGDKAQDRITGICGIAMGIASYLHNPDRIAIKREGVDANGKPWEMVWCDAPTVELVEAEAIAEAEPDPATGRKRGGPVPNGR